MADLPAPVSDQIDTLRSALPANLSLAAAFILGAAAFVVLVWAFRRIWMRIISLAGSVVFGWLVQQISHPVFADLLARYR